MAKKDSKWMETMIKKLGSREAVRAFCATNGRVGGQNSRLGGFAAEKVGKDGLTGRERASKVGTIGGKKSRRNRAR